MVNQVVIVHKVTVPVIVSLYHVLVSTLICILSPLFIVQVRPTIFPLIIRYPDVDTGLKDNMIGTEILITPAVYTLVVYQVFGSAEPLDIKFTHSGVVSRIADISPIYLPDAYCEGI